VPTGTAELEEALRKTPICGLGPAALGPAASMLKLGEQRRNP
jgi:hypothetical protein